MLKIKNYLLIAAVGVMLATSVFAQGRKEDKPNSDITKFDRFNPRKIDPKMIDPKMIDPRKINKSLIVSDLAVKDAGLWWLISKDYKQSGKKSLGVFAVATKNSKIAQFAAFDANGNLKPLTIKYEALDKNGKVLESCQAEWLGWTSDTTKENLNGCTLSETTASNYDRIRITVDSEKLLNELSTENNVFLSKVPDFNEADFKLSSQLP